MPACKSNQIINPLTGRCVLKNGQIGKQILGLSPPKQSKTKKSPKVKSPPKPKTPAKVKSPPKPRKPAKAPPKPKNPTKVKSPPKSKTDSNIKSPPLNLDPYITPSGVVDENTKKVAQITKFLILNPVNKTQAYKKRKFFIESMNNKYGHFFYDIESLGNLTKSKQKELYPNYSKTLESNDKAYAIIDLMKETRDYYDNLLFEGNLKKTQDITKFFYDEKDKRFGGNGIMSFLYYHQYLVYGNKNPYQEYILGDMKIINDTYLGVNEEIKNLEIDFKNKPILQNTLDIFGSFISIVVLIMEHEIAHQLNNQVDTYDNVPYENDKIKSGGGHTRQFWKIYSSYTGHDVHLNFALFYGLKNLILLGRKNSVNHIFDWLTKGTHYVSPDYAEEFVNKAVERVILASEH